MLQEIFDSRVESTEEGTNSNQEILNQNSRFTESHVTQSLSDIPEKLSEPNSDRPLAALMSSMAKLKYSSSDKSNTPR